MLAVNDQQPRLALIAATIVLVLAAAIVVLDDRVPGVPVRLAGAEVPADRIDDAIADLALLLEATPVVVVAGDRSASATAADLGLSVDVAAMTRAAREASSTGLRRLVPRLSALREVSLQVDAAATPTADRIARQLSGRPLNAAVLLDPGEGLGTVRPAVSGQVVTAEDVRDAVASVVRRGAAAAPGRPIEVVIDAEQVSPAIATSEADAVAARVAAIADGTILLRSPDGSDLASLRGADVATWLRVHRDADAEPGRRLSLVVVRPRVPQPVRDSLAAADQPAADAQIVVDQQEVAPPSREDPNDPERFTGTVRYEPEQIGVALDASATLAKVIAEAGPGHDVIEAVAAIEQPRVTTAEAPSLGVTEPISSFTTFYSSGQSRVTNIHRIAEIVDGVQILPGETFELNHFVGERTRARGFASGGAIANGEFITAVGGGVSQFATTFFNAAWFAGVQLDDFKPHSYYISRYPVGREATIDFPTVNLQVTNDTPHAIVVKTSVTSTSVTVTFWSTPYWTVQTDTGSRRGTSRGFRITVARTRTAPDGTSDAQSYTTDYRTQ